MFRRFQESMDEWRFIPEKRIKVKLENDDDLVRFMDGYDIETIKAVLDHLLIVKVDAQNKIGQALMRKLGVASTKGRVQESLLELVTTYRIPYEEVCNVFNHMAEKFANILAPKGHGVRRALSLIHI